jgi:hypothetical protein
MIFVFHPKKSSVFCARMPCLGPAASSSPVLARLPFDVLTRPPARLALASRFNLVKHCRVVAVAPSLARFAVHAIRPGTPPARR